MIKPTPSAHFVVEKTKTKTEKKIVTGTVTVTSKFVFNRNLKPKRLRNTALRRAIKLSNFHLHEISE